MGRHLVVGLLPKEPMDPTDIFTGDTSTGVITAIEEIGFSVRRIEKLGPTTAWFVTSPPYLDITDYHED